MFGFLYFKIEFGRLQALKCHIILSSQLPCCKYPCDSMQNSFDISSFILLSYFGTISSQFSAMFPLPFDYIRIFKYCIYSTIVKCLDAASLSEQSACLATDHQATVSIPGTSTILKVNSNWYGVQSASRVQLGS